MSNLVEVFHGRGGPAQRELYEAMLREARIPFVVKSDTGIAAHPVAVGPMAEFRILVDSEHLDQAGDMIQRLQDEEQEAVERLHEDTGDPPHETRGLLSRGPREYSPRDRLLLRVGGGICVVFGIYLLARMDTLGVLGILFLILGPLLLAAALKR